MKIDKSTIDKILKLNDDGLWSVIQMIISKSGVSGLKDIKRPKDMTKIRETLGKLTDDDISRAITLLKRGK